MMSARVPVAALAVALGWMLPPASGVAAQGRAARGTAQAPTRHEQRVPFAVGETLTYDVSWSSYLTAGTASLHVVDKKPSYGSTAYYIVAEGRPTPLLSKLYTLYYKADTLLDAYSLLPQRGSVYSEEGRRHRTKTTMFYPAKRQAEYTVETRTSVTRALPISPAAQDPLGALYVLRTIPLKAGERMTMPICDNGATYTMTIQAAATEPVKTALGDLPAQKLTITVPPEAGARAISLWLATDAVRTPVRMSAELPVGAFVLTLTGRQ